MVDWTAFSGTRPRQVPQLYQVGADPALVADGGGAAVKPAAKRVKKAIALPGFPPAPMYRFHGRAKESLDIGRAFRKHYAVLLSGMGGMGKTALAREAAAWWRRIGRFDEAVFCSFEQKAGAENVVQIIGKALEGEDFSSRSGEGEEGQWQTAVRLFHERKVLVVWDNFESTLPQYQKDEKDGKDGKDHEEGTDRARYERPGKKDERDGKDGKDQEEGTDRARGEWPGKEDERDAKDGKDPDGGAVAAPLVTFDEEARAQLRKLYAALVADAPEGRLLVTCRPQETGLPGIKEQRLAGLARPDSLHLLATALDVKGVSTDRPGHERPEIDALLDALDDHPLSIELVAPHLEKLTPGDIRKDFGKLLERFENAGAFEARNKSLLASLEFSRKRLSKEAQAVLPFLAWFEGGVFENVFLGFAELEAEAWASIRAELVATALVSVDDVRGLVTPYLRFHPTLPFAAGASEVPDLKATEGRFVAVYLASARQASKALHGSHCAAALKHLSLEEANFREALIRLFKGGAFHVGWVIANTLRIYLKMSGQLREHDNLVEWLRRQTERAELDQVACAVAREHAMTLVAQGKAEEAMAAVQTLIARIETEGLSDLAQKEYHLALSHHCLGSILDRVNRPGQALAPLDHAVEAFEELGDKHNDCLAATLAERANAYLHLGQYDMALKDAERALSIDKDLGHDVTVAQSLGRIAQIMTEQARYAEADARYTEAFDAASATGDLELEGALLQHRGLLHRKQGHHDRAVDLCQQAIARFQRAGDIEAEMQTCDILGGAEQSRGHLDAAGAWYERARQLAEQLGDRGQLAVVAQNVADLHRRRAEQASGEEECEALLRKAVTFAEQSLAGWKELGNPMHQATSQLQLGALHRELTELDQAEQYVMQALQTHESLNLPEVYRDYGILALIARDRGDADAAAEWQAKRDAKVAELERLARGPGGAGQAPGVPPELVKGVLGLAQAAYAARAGGTPLAPEAAEALATVAEWPAPLNGIAAFLETLAAGGPVLPVPAGLPGELEEVLEALAESSG